MNINNLQEAVEYFIKYFCPQGKVVATINGARGPPVCKVVKCGTKLNYVTKKTDWFYSFNKLFPQATEKGVAQTFDMTIINDANKENGVLITVMPDGHVYAADAVTAYKYITTNNTIRIPNEEISEQGSIAAKYLVRLQPNETL